jgi:hypothetical protein
MKKGVRKGGREIVDSRAWGCEGRVLA